MKIVSKSLKQTEEIAKEFVERLALATYEKAAIVGLYGDLGSGKTTFTQSVAKILGAKEVVTSPTFVIEKIYDIKHSLFNKLIHIDAYRLEEAKEMNALGWNEISENPHNLIIMEWPERVAEILPERHIKINFKFISENEREIEI
jgi:tRNA threonylcarbamoyladenosine biosynthesis protein TsaE